MTVGKLLMFFLLGAELVQTCRTFFIGSEVSIERKIHALDAPMTGLRTEK